MNALTLTSGIVAGLIVAYAIGYRNGVAWCMRELKPLQDAVEAMRAARLRK